MDAGRMESRSPTRSASWLLLFSCHGPGTEHFTGTAGHAVSFRVENDTPAVVDTAVGGSSACQSGRFVHASDIHAEITSFGAEGGSVLP